MTKEIKELRDNLEEVLKKAMETMIDMKQENEMLVWKIKSLEHTSAELEKSIHIYLESYAKAMKENAELKEQLKKLKSKGK